MVDLTAESEVLLSSKRKYEGALGEEEKNRARAEKSRILKLREITEDNSTVPPTGEAKLSAASPPDSEVLDRTTRQRFTPSDTSK